MSGLAAIPHYDGLPSVASALLDAADLCEARVGEAGTRLELVLDMALQQAAAVKRLLAQLAEFDLRAELMEQGAIREDHVGSSVEAGKRSRLLIAAVEEATDGLGLATREIRHCSESSRLLARQTHAEIERLCDPSLEDAASPVSRLDAELKAVSEDMRAMLDGIRFVLAGLRSVERVFERESLALGEQVLERLAGIEAHALETRALIDDFAAEEERRTAVLLQKTRDSLTHLQFQDPLCQELRDIARRVVAEDLTTDELPLLLARVERTSGRFGSPLAQARDSLRQIGVHCHDTASASQRRLARLFSEERDTLGASVSAVRSGVGAHIDRLERASVRKRALSVRALGQCDVLIRSEAAVRRLASQTRLVAANCAIKAAHVRGSGRAASVIACEIGTLDARVADAADELGGNTARLTELLPSLMAEADTSTAAARALGVSVGSVLEASESHVCSAEATLRDTVGNDPEIAGRVSALTDSALESLQMEGELDALLRVASEAFDALGVVAGDITQTQPLDGGPREDHPVAAGELLLF